MTYVHVEQVEDMIKGWQQECADFPAIYNQGNVLRDRLDKLTADIETPITWIDVSAWSVWKNHAIPVNVADYIQARNCRGGGLGMSRFDPDMPRPDDAPERESLEEAWRFQEDMEPAPMTKSPSPSVDEVAAKADLDLVADLRRLAAATRDCTVCDGDGIKANGNQCGGCGGTGKVPAWWGVEKTLAAAADRLASLVSPPKAGSGEPLTDRLAAWFNSLPDGGMGKEHFDALLSIVANHEARGDGVRVTDEMVDAAFNGYLSVANIPYEPDKPHPKVAMRAALEAALPPLGDGRAEIAALLDAYDAETRALPLGHEMPTRGASTYNWRRSVVDDIRRLAGISLEQGEKP